MAFLFFFFCSLSRTSGNCGENNDCLPACLFRLSWIAHHKQSQCSQEPYQAGCWVASYELTPFTLPVDRASLIKNSNPSLWLLGCDISASVWFLCLLSNSYSTFFNKTSWRGNKKTQHLSFNYFSIHLSQFWRNCDEIALLWFLFESWLFTKLDVRSFMKEQLSFYWTAPCYHAAENHPSPRERGL